MRENSGRADQTISTGNAFTRVLHHAAVVQISGLRNSHTALIKAVAQAQAAARYLLNNRTDGGQLLGSKRIAEIISDPSPRFPTCTRLQPNLS